MVLSDDDYFGDLMLQIPAALDVFFYLAPFLLFGVAFFFSPLMCC